MSGRGTQKAQNQYKKRKEKDPGFLCFLRFILRAFCVPKALS
jgi:hypothetical protein